MASTLPGATALGSSIWLACADRPPERGIVVFHRCNAAQSLAAEHGVGLGNVRGLQVLRLRFFHLRTPLFEDAGQGGAHRRASSRNSVKRCVRFCITPSKNV